VTFASKATVAPPLLAVLVKRSFVHVVVRIAAVIFGFKTRAVLILLSKCTFVLSCLQRSAIARATLPAHAGRTTAAADPTPLLLVPAAALRYNNRCIHGIQSSNA